MFHPVSPSRIVPLWDMVGRPTPRGLLGLGDPDMHVVDGTSTMLLGGFSTSSRNRLYVATLDPGADLTSAAWSMDLDRRGRARAIAPDPPKDAWDAQGMHTPSCVLAVDGQPARPYYMGRASRKQYGPASSYAIGALELIGGQWIRREEPLIHGGALRFSVLEQMVVHDRGRFVMWFQANPHQISPGELPDYELRAAESDDGMRWSEPQVFATPIEGFFANAITRTKDGWLVMLAQGSDLHDTGGLPAQGLWAATAGKLSTDRAAWSPRHHVRDTADPRIPASIARGTYEPGLLHDIDRDRTVIYATGVRAAPAWPRLLAQRVIRGQQPVVPSPFHLSAAAIELSLRGTHPPQPSMC